MRNHPQGYKWSREWNRGEILHAGIYRARYHDDHNRSEETDIVASFIFGATFGSLGRLPFQEALFGDKDSLKGHADCMEHQSGLVWKETDRAKRPNCLPPEIYSNISEEATQRYSNRGQCEYARETSEYWKRNDEEHKCRPHERPTWKNKPSAD